MNEEYGRLIKRAALTATVFATVFLILKIYGWWQTSSVTMLASLVDSLVDIAASLTNFLVIRYSLRPADDNHSFGHGKAESLAALAQSMFITGSALFLLLMGAERLMNQHPIQNTEIGIGITIITFICTLFLVLYQIWVIKKTGSQAIKADKIHYQSDMVMNGAILIALVISYYGFTQADAIFSILIAIYILYQSLRLAYDSIQSLLDHSLPARDHQKIQAIIEQEPGILGFHDLRTRRSGGTRFIQVHIELEDNIHLLNAHVISQNIEDKLLNCFPRSDIIIHLDPISVLEEEKSKEK